MFCFTHIKCLKLKFLRELWEFIVDSSLDWSIISVQSSIFLAELLRLFQNEFYLNLNFLTFNFVTSNDFRWSILLKLEWMIQWFARRFAKWTKLRKKIYKREKKRVKQTNKNTQNKQMIYMWVLIGIVYFSFPTRYSIRQSTHVELLKSVCHCEWFEHCTQTHINTQSQIELLLLLLF